MYLYNPYALVPGLSFLLVAALGLYIALERPHTTTGYPFLRFVLISASALLTMAMTWLSRWPEVALLWGWPQNVALFLMPAAFLHLILVLTRGEMISRWRRVVLLLYLPPLLLIGALLLGRLQLEPRITFYGYNVVPAGGRWLFALYEALYYLFALILSLSTWRRTSAGEVRHHQLRYVSLALFVAFLIGATSEVILPLYRVVFPSLMGPAIAIFVVVTFYASRRYQLFSVIPISLSTVVEAIPDGVAVLDDGNRIVAANAAFRRLFHLPEGADSSPKRVQIRQLMEHLTDPEEAIKAMEQALQSSDGFVGATVTFAETGRTYDMQITPIRQRDRLIALVTVLRDITPLKQLEAEVAEYAANLERVLDACAHAWKRSETRYQELVETIFDLVFTVDREGRYTFINSRSRGVLGYEPAELIGRPITPMIPPRNRPQVQALFQRALREAVELEEIAIYTRDRQVRYLSGILGPLVEEGEVVGVQGVVRDVTEQRQMRERLIRSEKLTTAGLLAAGLAHDIRAPLTVIKGYLELTQEELPDNHPVQEMLNRVSRQMDRIDRLAEELARIGGPHQDSIQPTDLNAILRNDLIDIARIRLSSQGIHSRLELVEPLPLVYVSPSQVVQILLNLIHNAADAMPQGGSLILRTRVQDQAVVLEVEDTGHGIAPEIMPHIFEPYFTTKKKKGTGLGLFMVQSIINHYGGTVEVESRVGEGTIFRLHFPIRP